VAGPETTATAQQEFLFPKREREHWYPTATTWPATAKGSEDCVAQDEWA